MTDTARPWWACTGQPCTCPKPVETIPANPPACPPARALASLASLATELELEAWALRYAATGSYDDGLRRAKLSAADRIRGAVDNVTEARS